MTPMFPARAAGRALRAGFALLQRFRHPRPIHSRGLLLDGAVHWITDAPQSGIAWIDEPPRQRSAPVVARLSRSVGLPSPLPDVLGLALRVETSDGPADIEFASTGVGVPLRFALIPHRRASRASYGTLLPYRGTRGPVLLRARPLGPPLPSGGRQLERALSAEDWRLGLFFASPLGRWHPFAVLTLRHAPDRPDELRFDAGSRMLPGARMDGWVRAVRQPSYDRVQR
ncbi:hypothetical protein AB3M83_09325 [Microbacterium sp. 179-B 1A2 NHS]|uniref:hypothetical protein n=1 Tax=Microbacterium sp. 179-B 1A2 NHS TaxID=3142383 RepID=UPI00399F124A